MTKLKLSADEGQLLIALWKRGAIVRAWFNAYGELVGIWRSKTGVTIAWGRTGDYKRSLTVYRGIRPEDDFARGGNVGQHIGPNAVAEEFRMAVAS